MRELSLQASRCRLTAFVVLLGLLTTSPPCAWAEDGMMRLRVQVNHERSYHQDHSEKGSFASSQKKLVGVIEVDVRSFDLNKDYVSVLSVSASKTEGGTIVSQNVTLQASTKSRHRHLGYCEGWVFVQGHFSGAADVERLSLSFKKGLIGGFALRTANHSGEDQVEGVDLCGYKPRDIQSTHRRPFYGEFTLQNPPPETRVCTVVANERTPTGWRAEQRCRSETHTETRLVSIDIVSGKPGDSVAIEGCTDLVAGEVATVAASGKPAGGRYRWSVDSGGPVGLSASGEKASLTCRAPGKATISVEYTPPSGKAPMRSTKEASCTRLAAVNGGRPIPKLGLYDVEGMLRSPIVQVPLTVEPADGGGKLTFKPANEALLSAMGLSNSVRLQGVKEGTTTVAPLTSCGKEAGPKFPVQVVPCDDDVIAELRRREQHARGRLDSNRRQQNALVSDDEFDRAAREIADDTLELAKSTGELIVDSLTAPKGAAGPHVETVKSVYSAADNLQKAVSGRWQEAAVGTAIDVLGTAAQSFVHKALEASEAAAKFGQDLGTLYGVADRLAELHAQETETVDELRRVSLRLHEKCKAGAAPKATETQAATPKPPAADAKIKSTAASQQRVRTSVTEIVPAGSETTGSSGSERTATRAPRDYGSVGGSRSSRRTVSNALICQATGEGTRRDMLVRAAGDLKTLRSTIDRWRSEATEFRSAMDQLKALLDRFKTANGLPQRERSDALRDLRTQLRGFLRTIQRFDQTTTEATESLNGCQDSLPAHVAIMRHMPTGLQ